MNLKVQVIYKETVGLLSTLYDLREAEAISNRLFEDLLGVNKITRLTSTDILFSNRQSQLYKNAIARLLDGEPLQYIIGFADFYGRQYAVNSETLIPRNETEELVDWIISNHKSQTNLSVLDIGTGSGCIAISLALGMNHSRVSAWDISAGAISCAQENTNTHKSKVEFRLVDILEQDKIPPFDIIVSNPPYIPNRDKEDMHENILAHEPISALFVSDENPLIFYDKITSLAKESLSPNGKLYFEIHENFGTQTIDLISDYGFRDVMIKEDLNDKHRMICATNPQ